MKKNHRLILVFLVGHLLWLPMKGQYYDFSVESSAADFVDSVKQSVGDEKFSEVPRIYAFTLAKTLGQLDRNTLTPEAFIEHIEEAEQVRNRFYPDISTVNYRTYLLPIRVRSEYLTQTGWRKSLRDKLEPEITGVTDPSQAAIKVLAWCKSKVKLTDEDAAAYPLGLKGDLDPITTLRSGYASEIDLSILAIAALRSVGVVSRMVYTHVIAGESGGKVWVEYRTGKGWNAWVASAPEGTDGKQYLLRQFSGHFTLILANPEQPINITSSYIPVSYLDVAIDNADPKNRPGWNLLVSGKNQLYPITGRNIFEKLPDSIEVGAGEYVISAGDRVNLAALQPISLKAGQYGSYVLDLAKGTQTFDLVDNPSLSANATLDDVQEMDPSAVHDPAQW
jgi:Transglutaminase-like superfamily